MYSKFFYSETPHQLPHFFYAGKKVNEAWKSIFGLIEMEIQFKIRE